MKEVDLEEFERCVRYFRQINDPPLKDLVFVVKGKKLDPVKEDLKDIYDDFECVGLMNTDYLKMFLGI